MKSRVALIATLSVLISLIALVILSSTMLINERNEDICHNLEVTGILATGYSTPANNAGNTETLYEFLDNAGVRYGIFDINGGLIKANDRNMSLSDEDIAHARGGQISAYEEESTGGESYSITVYSAKQQYIKLSIYSVDLYDIATGRLSAVFVGAFLLLSFAFFITLITLTIRRRLAIEHVMHVLDSFSEGHFDARLTQKQGFKRSAVVEYNAILDRMDQRVFNQRSRNQALSVVMNQMQNGILAVDDKLHVILITPVAKQLLGVSGNAQGMHINDASQDVKLDSLLSDAMRQDGVYTNEVAARTAVGRGHRPLRLYVSAMRKDNKVVGALAMIEDITELRQLEQVRSDFVANVSHELKTPLTSIKGFVETLLDGALDNHDMATKFLNIIMVEAERLTRLINDILSISKLESGMKEVEIERLRFDKAAFDVCEMLRLHASEKQITINAHLNQKPIYIMGNKDRVEQLLLNLIENGIKYNKPGGSVTVQVSIIGEQAYLTVADTGIGIPKEHLDRLFERFYRVDKGRSRSMGGTGLGLAIVKHIAKSMGGDIEVHSEFGEGSEFCVYLPLAPDQAEHEIVDYGEDDYA